MLRGSYNKFEQQRKFLLRYVVLKALEDRDEEEPLPASLKEFLASQDLSVTLLVILTLGPACFKYTLASEGNMTQDQNWLFEQILSARHKKFISMISSAINQAKDSTPQSISESLSRLFMGASFCQKRMLL